MPASTSRTPLEAPQRVTDAPSAVSGVWEPAVPRALAGSCAAIQAKVIAATLDWALQSSFDELTPDSWAANPYRHVAHIRLGKHNYSKAEVLVSVLVLSLSQSGLVYV